MAVAIVALVVILVGARWFNLGIWITPLVIVVLASLAWVFIALLSALRALHHKRDAEHLGDRSISQDAREPLAAGLSAMGDKIDRALAFLRERNSRQSIRERLFRRQSTWIIVGPPGSGKSALIKAVHLSVPPGSPFDPSENEAATANFDLWITDEGLFFDTVGSYAIHEDQETDPVVWSAFLGYLRRWHHKRPVKGIIVPVPVAGDGGVTLLSVEESARLANALRKRIQEIAERLNVDAPIYLVFTKCDLLSGFAAFFNELSPEERKQAVGRTFRFFGIDQTRNLGELDAEFHDATNNLYHRRIAILQKCDLRSYGCDAIYEFPEQFRASSSSLIAFVREMLRLSTLAFQPRLRGVYFTGIAQFGLADEPQRQSGSFFIEDLFHRIILKDRALSGSIRRRLPYFRARQVLGASVALLLTALAVWGLWEKHGQKSHFIDTLQNDLDEVSKKQRPSNAISNLDKAYWTISKLEGRDRNGGESAPVALGFTARELHDGAQSRYFAMLREQVLRFVVDSLYRDLMQGKWPLSLTKRSALSAMQLLTTERKPNSARVDSLSSLVASLVTTVEAERGTITGSINGQLTYYWRDPKDPLEVPEDWRQSIHAMGQLLKTLDSVEVKRRIWVLQGFPPLRVDQVEIVVRRIQTLAQSDQWSTAVTLADSVSRVLESDILRLRNELDSYRDYLQRKLQKVVDSCGGPSSLVRAAARDTLDSLELRFRSATEKSLYRTGIDWAKSTDGAAQRWLSSCSSAPTAASLDVSVVPENQSAKLKVDGQLVPAGRQLSITSGWHELEVIHPEFPIFKEGITISGNLVKVVDLESKFGNRTRFDLRIGLYPFQEGDTLRIRLNGGIDRALTIFPHTIAQLLRGMWSFRATVVTADGRNGQVDSCVFFPDGAGWLRAKAPGTASDQVDFARWSGKTLIPVTFYWTRP